jgi:hypothetical protein
VGPRWVGYVLPALGALGGGRRPGHRAERPREKPGHQPALEPGSSAAHGWCRLSRLSSMGGARSTPLVAQINLISENASLPLSVSSRHISWMTPKGPRMA